MSFLQEKSYKDIFAVGALWNLAVGLGNLTLFQTSMRLLFGKQAITKAVSATLPLRFFYIAVAIFGWGYSMVSQDLRKNRGIVWMGILAKAVIFAAFVWYYRLKQIKIMALLAGCVDLVFTVLFAMFLWDTRKER